VPNFEDNCVLTKRWIKFEKLLFVRVILKHLNFIALPAAAIHLIEGAECGKRLYFDQMLDKGSKTTFCAGHTKT